MLKISNSDRFNSNVCFSATKKSSPSEQKKPVEVKQQQFSEVAETVLGFESVKTLPALPYLLHQI